MDNTERILIAVDNSSSSHRAVSYVAEMLSGSHDFHVGLLHLKAPPRMEEWGGSMDPEVEDKVSNERAEIYQEMENEVMEKGEDLLERFESSLSRPGIDVTRLMVEFEGPLNASHISNHLLSTAAEGKFGTIVVGRHSFSGLKRLFGHHVSDKLIANEDGPAIWVVG